MNGGVKQSTWTKVFNSKAVWEEKVSRWFRFKPDLEIIVAYTFQ